MNCTYCGKELIIVPHANNKKFCNRTCRNKYVWQQNRDVLIQGQRAKSGRYAEGKIQCLLCGNWYVKPLAHVWQIHKMDENEYKIKFDLPLSYGIIPEYHRELLKEYALDNHMDKQLMVAGLKTRYVKGDPKNKIVTGWKGRRGSLGFSLLVS